MTKRNVRLEIHLRSFVRPVNVSLWALVSFFSLACSHVGSPTSSSSTTSVQNISGTSDGANSSGSTSTAGGSASSVATGGSSSTSGSSDSSGSTDGVTQTSASTLNAGSISLAGANQTTVAFGAGFQKFVYSQTLPGAVNFTGLSGKIAIDSNSPYFSEALFTVGYAPGGSCPGNGQSFMDYDTLFATMPGSVILQQYIIKIVGGHLELPTQYTLAEPIAISGCAFIIMDGDAGAKGSVDTLTSNVTFDYVDGAQDTNNQVVDAGGGEYCAGYSKGCNSSSTNQWRTSVKLNSGGLLTSLTGSISAAPLYIYKATSLPAGNWSVHNKFYVDPQCSGGTGNQTGQDFYSQIPANAIPLYDVTQTSSGENVAQQSIDQAVRVQVSAGDCLVQLLQTSGAGPIDIEVQMKGNVGDEPFNPVMGNIDGFDGHTVSGWACAEGSDQSISVDIYAGALGTGSFLTRVSADQASETAVATACGANGTAYRFSQTFTDDQIAAYLGQGVYAYGISPNGADNLALSNSGRYVWGGPVLASK